MLYCLYAKEKVFSCCVEMNEKRGRILLSASQEEHMNQEFMKEKKILPLVVSMSLPMVISMAVNALYNIIDSYFVAKVSEHAMTALALVFPVQNLVSAVTIGFGIGVNANVAFYLGAGEQKRACQAATQGVLFNFLHGAVLTVICILGMPWFLGMFSNDSQVVSMALTYANRALLFSVILAVGVTYEKIFQSVGQMKVSMFSMLCGCVANIILDPLMIFGIGIFPAMGIAGAAYATGIGQGVSLAIYLLWYLFRPIPVKIKWEYLASDKELMARLYGVGIPASLNIALPSFLITALNGILAGFSEKYVLVLGVYYKLQTFIYLTANGIVQGIRPLIGYNYGAGEHQRVRQIFYTALELTAAVMLVGTVISWLIPATLIGLFTTNSETIHIGVRALHIISLGFVASSVSVACSGSLEGLGKGMPSMCISLARYVVVILPLAFVFSRFLGADGVWYAFCATEIITAGISYIIYKKQVAT